MNSIDIIRLRQQLILVKRIIDTRRIDSYGELPYQIWILFTFDGVNEEIRFAY